MRAITHQPKATIQATPAKTTISGRANFGQRRDVNSILHLQRTIGNQAVQRLLEVNPGIVEGDSTTVRLDHFGHNFSQIPMHTATPKAVQLQPSFRKGDKETDLSPEEPAPATLQSEPTKPVLTPEAPFSGTVPDIKTSPGKGRRTEEELAADPHTPGGAGNVVADIHLSFSQPKTGRVGVGKDDPVVSGVSMGSFSQPGGRSVSPFGSEFYEPSFTGISYSFADSKCTIKAKLDLACPWGTNAGGCTDVPSATDSVITKANWPAIKADLKPESVSPFKSPRTNYYSKALVERHEKFHGTDDHGWTVSSGLNIVKTHLEAGTVTSPGAAITVAGLLDSARIKLISENFKWYKGGGTSHSTYAGEIRAYADGKDLYQKLADDVETHGKSLP